MFGQIIGMFACGMLIAASIVWFNERTEAVMSGSENAASSSISTEKLEPKRAVAGMAVQIDKGADGHFRTQVRLNHAMVPVLIDTGASLLALRQGDAKRAGIYLDSNDFIYGVNTANGVAKAAKVDVRQLEIGQIVIRDVEAFVLPDDALATNLLGMNVLSEFGEVSFRGETLVLDTTKN